MSKKKLTTIRGASFKLNDQRVENTIQILRVGKFDHQIFGEFIISPKMLQSMVKNFRDNVRGVDIAIDYAHENDQRAAGWITDLYLKENDSELWAEVRWTDPALRSLDNKEWRYISAEFIDDFVDNETKKSFGPTLFGAALTNRPFVKGMAPAVELNEKLQGDLKMDNEKMLSELRDNNHKILAQNIKIEGELSGWKTLGDNPQAVSKKLGDLETENKTLKDANEKAEKEKVLAERQTKFDELVKAGKVVKAQSDFVLSLTDEQFIKFAESAQPVDVNVKPAGSGADANGTEDPEAKIIELAEAKVEKTKGLSINDAMSIVLSENPELAKAYESKGA